jgi:hypothetical protein
LLSREKSITPVDRQLPAYTLIANGPVALHAMALALAGTLPMGKLAERPLRLTAAGRRKLEAVYPSWKAAQDSLTTQKRRA